MHAARCEILRRLSGSRDFPTNSLCHLPGGLWWLNRAVSSHVVSLTNEVCGDTMSASYTERQYFPQGTREEKTSLMARIRPLLLASVCCLLVSTALSAQAGGGIYFQELVKEARTRIREIRPDQLGPLRAANLSVVLVDVREDNEWNRSRIPGAIHVGRGVLEASFESRVPQKATPVVVYCQSGGRSALAADVLAKMGYTNIWSLAGGMAAYQAAGMLIDQAAPPR